MKRLFRSLKLCIGTALCAGLLVLTGCTSDTLTGADMAQYDTQAEANSGTIAKPGGHNKAEDGSIEKPAGHNKTEDGSIEKPGGHN